ncbi:MAG: response regulator transcription factor, partial [Rhodanobacter sp.]
MRILLAEDDASIAEGICASLRHGGHAVDHVAAGNLADAALRDHDYDL